MQRWVADALDGQGGGHILKMRRNKPSSEWAYDRLAAVPCWADASMASWNAVNSRPNVTGPREPGSTRRSTVVCGCARVLRALGLDGSLVQNSPEA